MKRRLFGISGMLAALLTFVVLVSCATTVPIQSVRRPTIDTSSIERMAFKPFENASGVGGPVAAQTLNHLNSKAEQTLAGTKFTKVAPTDPNADGILTGKITNISSNDTSEQIQRKDKEGNVYTVTRYNREVSLAFEYSVISARTGMAISTVSKSGRQTSSAEGDRSRLSAPEALARSIVDSQIRSLYSDIEPTIVSTNRKLMNETSKDKAIKAQMKEVVNVVKSGNYQLAIEQYDKIGTLAAQTNAALLREAISSASAASAEMDRLFNERGGPVDKAITGAVDALFANIPDGENITILKSQSTERAMLDRVIDQITKNVVESGKLTVIDRSNRDLINAEQQFQASGNVSDDTAVSIGKQLGIHYIALCWIGGEMSMRKLNLRVLNVETSAIAYQTDFDI